MGDADPNAEWRGSLLSHADFLNEVLSGSSMLVGLFKLPGFRVEFVVADVMHTVCLGIAQVLLGNIYWELFQSLNGVYKEPQVALGQLLAMIKLAARTINKTMPINQLTIGMIRGCETSAPRLKLKAW
eukprot:9498862-Pyramimonas_sp.AAC.1